MYYPVFALLWLFSLLPFRVLYGISDLMYLLVYHLIGYRKKVVFTNLRNAFPEKTDEERLVIAKGFYRHLCDLMLETIALLSMSGKSIRKRFVFENPEMLDELYDRGKSVAMVTGHYSNWEWYSGFPFSHKHLCIVIYKSLKNKIADRLINHLRSKFGNRPVEKREAYRFILHAHQEGRLLATGYVGDQTPTKGDSRYWTTFLNQDTAVFLGVEKIAKKTNEAVVFIHIKKHKRGHYRCRYIKLFDDCRRTQPYEVTEAHVRTLENIIRGQPEYWLWSHRRWKHKKPANAEVH